MLTPSAFDVLRATRAALVSAPAEEPISLSDVKVHLGLEDTTAHDPRLTAVRIAARQQVEADTGLKLVTQTWDLWLDACPAGSEIWLPIGPLQAVTSVTTYNDSDVATVLNASSYVVDALSPVPRIVLRPAASWPTALRETNAVAIRVVTGYGAATAVPQALKQAMYLLVGSLSEHREQVIVSQFAGQFLEVPYGYRELIQPFIAPYRMW